MSDYSDNERDLIYKKANSSMILSIYDNTNDTWDVEDYNNLRINFVNFDKNNKAKVLIPFYVNADEFMAVMERILNGTFSKTQFDSKGSYVSYGGSKAQGLAQKRVDGELERIIDGPESRIFKIYLNNGKLYVSGDAYKGKIVNNGAITKKGDRVSGLYYSMSPQEAIVMASTVLSYLKAKKTLAVSAAMRK